MIFWLKQIKILLILLILLTIKEIHQKKNYQKSIDSKNTVNDSSGFIDFILANKLIRKPSKGL